MKKDYFKYVSASEEDKLWGLFIADAGTSHILPDEPYPDPAHPSSYYFTWEKGRILHEYQVLYVVRGAGVFESKTSGIKPLPAGTVVWVAPGMWHRYKPVPEKGWDTYWVGFNGEQADRLFRQGYFNPPQQVLQIGHHERLVSLFMEIIDAIRDEPSGYQQEAAGAVMHMMGFIYSKWKEKGFENSEIQQIVRQAKILFIENLESGLKPEDVAIELGIGYSRFRKLFKEYTGMAPGQYQINLRIQKAKELLMRPSLSIKEVAYTLGFESNHYFTRLFKEKTGMNPKSYRQESAGE